MAIEEERFANGGYRVRNQTPIPAYVELLIAHQDGKITDTGFEAERLRLRQTDVRAEVLKYLYQRSLNRQFALNVSGGGENHHYFLSAGYDKNRGGIKGNADERLNISMQNTLRVGKKMEFTGALFYTLQERENNGISFSELSDDTFSPYTALADDQGRALPVVQDYRLAYQQTAGSLGLLDWLYRPLEDRELVHNTGKNAEIRLNGGVRYRIVDGLEMNATYQYLQNKGEGQTHYRAESYYVRNLVNRYTQADGTQVIPHGDILRGDAPTSRTAHSGRLQLSYSSAINDRLQLSVLSGAEVRQQVENRVSGHLTYGYDPEVMTGVVNLNYDQRYNTRPTGSALIPVSYVGMARLTDRYLSYYGNAALDIAGKYVFSGSLRWDGSNLFGVKANQKGVPLWSAGSSWDISKEPFFHSNQLSYLRLRLTYGSSGNVNKNVSVFPIISYSADPSTQLQMATLRSAGNPSLAWEQVNTLNGGIDFSMCNDRISGSVEYYIKNATNLIGEDLMDPTTGIVNSIFPLVVNRINYGSLRNRGWDVQINTRNLTGKFQWDSQVLFSYVSNRLMAYNVGNTSDISSYFQGHIRSLEVGQSIDVLYALPWHGLDGRNGRTLIYLDGKPTGEYRNYYENYPVDQLIHAGVTRPPYFGSLVNSVSYGGFRVTANIIWKAGFVFRRPSMEPGAEFRSVTSYHLDYFRRWQKPGDELTTDVPAALPYSVSTSSNEYFEALVYQASAALVTKGDYIRLQDINVSYQVPYGLIHGLGVRNANVYVYMRNLGLLWRANKHGIDPEYTGASYPSPLSLSVGVKINL